MLPVVLYGTLRKSVEDGGANTCRTVIILYTRNLNINVFWDVTL
jgi:hypothetical protein